MIRRCAADAECSAGLVGIALLNLLLCAGKFLAGLLSGSIAITADAFNNLSDDGLVAHHVFRVPPCGAKA